MLIRDGTPPRTRCDAHVELYSWHGVMHIIERLAGPTARFGIEIDDIASKTEKRSARRYTFVRNPRLIAMQGQRFKVDRHQERWHARFLRDSIIEASCGLKARDGESTWGSKWRGDRGAPIQFDVSCEWILEPCFRRGHRILILFASASRIHGDLQIRDARSSCGNCRIHLSTHFLTTLKNGPTPSAGINKFSPF
jgi:hypothetical protein